MAHSITEACVGCTACVRCCPVFAIEGERGSRHVINARRCVDCGVCGRVCPKGAVANANGETCAAVKRPLWPKPHIDTEACSSCGICVNYCGAGALAISAPQFRGDIRTHAELASPAKCVACALCERHCPVGAIVMRNAPREGVTPLRENAELQGATI
jgi:formate hydrogenlyase subunit 6/NADH:ubiquinone oxidoreductase subunit I